MMEIVEMNHKHTKAYLIRNEREWLMIDAGWPDSLKPFRLTMKEHQISYQDIKYLIVTHYHMDHAGLTQPIKGYGVPLLLHPCQIGYPEEMNRFFIKHPDKNYQPIDESGVKLISESESTEILKELGIDGVIISTPGHSPDSISVIIRNQCVFTGDLPPYDLKDAYSSPSVTESWDTIERFHVTDVYPAHGNHYQIIKK